MAEKCFCHLNGYAVKDAEARKSIEALRNRNRRIILMADSWGNYNISNVHYSFTEIVKQNLDPVFGAENIINISVGSRGFVFNPSVGTFLTGLQGAAIENPETVTDIIVAGGTNDMAGIATSAISLKSISAAISEFVAYCRTAFPNAYVKIGCVGNHYNDRTAVLNVRKEYRKCVNYGAEYITNSEYICDNSRFIDYSGIHPTATGFDNLGYYFTQYILSGRIDVEYGAYLPESESLNDKFSSTVYPLISCKQRNGEYELEIPLNGIGFIYKNDKKPTISTLGTDIDLCTYKDYQVVNQKCDCLLSPVHGWLAMGDGTTPAFSGILSYVATSKTLRLTILPGSITSTSTANILNISFARAKSIVTFE